MNVPEYVLEALKYASFYHSEDDDPFTGFEGFSVCNYCNNSATRHQKGCPIGKIEAQIGRASNNLATVYTNGNNSPRTIRTPASIKKDETIFDITFHKLPKKKEMERLEKSFDLVKEVSYDFN